ncbi:unnamed protein product [Lampetra planeri]
MPAQGCAQELEAPEMLPECRCPFSGEMARRDRASPDANRARNYSRYERWRQSQGVAMVAVSLLWSTRGAESAERS